MFYENIKFFRNKVRKKYDFKTFFARGSLNLPVGRTCYEKYRIQYSSRDYELKNPFQPIQPPLNPIAFTSLTTVSLSIAF